MRSLRILDALSKPGREDGINDDCYGSNETGVYVIDGATGLSDRPVMRDCRSDAAWFARFAADHFGRHATAGTDLRAVVADLCHQARGQFWSAAADQVERYAWPSASFAMMRLGEAGLEFFGLGDCSLYFRQEGSAVDSWSPLPQFSDYESRLAAGHMAGSSGFNRSGSLLDDQKTLQDLRTIRALQNTVQSGIWTLGLVPEAADHIARHALPMDRPFRALLCSDGFSALVDTYRAHSPGTLLEAAEESGLDALYGELRTIERESDPDAKKFPRYKQSDDATAVLVEVS